MESSNNESSDLIKKQSYLTNPSKLIPKNRFTNLIKIAESPLNEQSKLKRCTTKFYQNLKNIVDSTDNKINAALNTHILQKKPSTETKTSGYNPPMKNEKDDIRLKKTKIKSILKTPRSCSLITDAKADHQYVGYSASSTKIKTPVSSSIDSKYEDMTEKNFNSTDDFIKSLSYTHNNINNHHNNNSSNLYYSKKNNLKVCFEKNQRVYSQNGEQNEQFTVELISFFTELIYVLITTFKYWCIFFVASMCFMIGFASKFAFLVMFSFKNISLALMNPLKFKLIKRVLETSIVNSIDGNWKKYERPKDKQTSLIEENEEDYAESTSSRDTSNMEKKFELNIYEFDDYISLFEFMVNKKFDSEIQERHNENVIVGNSIGEMKIKKSTTVCGVPSLSSTLKCKNLLMKFLKFVAKKLCFSC